MQYARAAAERAASAASAAAASARGTSSAGADDSGSTTSRYSILSVTSLLSSDPDKTHDNKLKGVTVDPSMSATKDALRRLRTTLETVATFYAKYAEPPKKPSTTTSAMSMVGALRTGTTSAGVTHSLEVTLVLPELAEWPKNELFCGSSGCGEQLLFDASRLAAIEALMVAERAAIGTEVVPKLHEGARMVVETLEGLYAFELQLRDATHALEAAHKALKRGEAAEEAAENDERKAGAQKDDKKREAAQAAAQKAKEKATADIAEGREAIARGEAEMMRLVSEAQPVALDAALAGRHAAETGPICDAITTLANAYHDFVRGSTAVVHGQQQPSADYNPSVVRKAPKEKEARFAAYIVQWTLAKRRCKSSAALLEEFVKLRIDTALAPIKEVATLDAIAAEVDDETVKARIEAIRLPEAELSAACGSCRTAVATLVEALGLCRQLFKAGVGEAEEYEKKAKALWALQAKRDAAYKEVGKLESKAAEDPKLEASLSKKRAELQALKEECETKAAALETAAAELESFATELASDEGERSVATLVGNHLQAFIAQYGLFCATRGRDMPVLDEDAPMPVPMTKAEDEPANPFGGPTTMVEADDVPQPPPQAPPGPKPPPMPPPIPRPKPPPIPPAPPAAPANDPFLSGANPFLSEDAPDPATPAAPANDPWAASEPAPPAAPANDPWAASEPAPPAAPANDPWAAPEAPPSAAAPTAGAEAEAPSAPVGDEVEALVAEELDNLT